MSLGSRQYCFRVTVLLESIIQGRRKWYGLNGNGRTGFWLNLF